MTINQITSTIRSRVMDGLSGTTSTPDLSLLQIEDEVDLQRLDIISKYSLNAVKLNKNFLYQTKDGLKVECHDISQIGCGVSSGDTVMGVKIPPIASTIDDSAIEYFGLQNKQKRFIVYFDLDSVNNHRRRIKTKNSPFIWVDTSADQDGYMTAYFMNMNPYDGLRFVSMRAIFSYPSMLFGGDNDYGDTEYPAPGEIQAKIIDSLTEKYVRYYRQMSVPNMPAQAADNI